MRILRRACRLAAVFALLACTIFQSAAFAAEPYQAVKAEIPALCKTVEGDPSHIYTVVMEPIDSDAPAPESGTLSIKHGETGKFAVDLTEPGTFRYRMYVRPDPDAPDGTVFDDAVYIVSLYCEVDEQDPGKLLCSVILNYEEGETVKPTAVAFENSVAGSSDSDGDSSSTPTVDPNSLIPPHDPDRTTVYGEDNRPDYRMDSAGESNPTTVPVSRTGDDIPLGLAAGILAVSILVIVVIVVLSKRRGKGVDSDHR